MTPLARDGDELVWTLRTDEHALLTVLLEDLDQALDGPTDDPVVERLFPPAVEGDRDEDAELRTLIAAELLMKRHDAIALLLEILGRVDVPPSPSAGAGRSGRGGITPTVDVVLVDDEPGMMLSVLNDVRLALAARVGLTAVELPQLVEDSDERTHALLAMIDHLAYLQMQLLRAIDPVSVEHAEPDEDVPGA